MIKKVLVKFILFIWDKFIDLSITPFDLLFITNQTKNYFT